MDRNIFAFGLAATILATPMTISAQEAANAGGDTASRSAQTSKFLKVSHHSAPQGGHVHVPYTYTSLVVSFEGSDADGDVKTRNGVQRLFNGKRFSSAVVVKAEAGSFIDTVPLSSRSYESSRRAGETFSRAMDMSRGAFPAFLVRPDAGSTMARLTVTSDVVDGGVGSLAGDALSGFREALKFVAPSSSVLTTLTKESADKVAGKIDEQVNKFFGISVADKIVADLDIAKGQRLEIEVFGLPAELDQLRKLDAEPVSMGKWIVSFSAPRPSIFSSETCADAACTAAATAARATALKEPGTVLNFKLVEQVAEIGTVRSYLQQQDWWAAAIKDLETGTKGSGEGFCRRVGNAVAHLGLNALDGQIIAEAVGKSDLLSVAGSAALQKGSCIAAR